MSKPKKRGIDALLTLKGKPLQPGESVSFRLIRGPARSIAGDPVDPKAPPESFPLLAKFGESVQQPNFESSLRDGRLYQQDIPKPLEDSDEEDGIANADKKKRWKYKKRNDAPPRQWILQEQIDFLETMVARREKKVAQQKISSRYEGTPEHNASHYALFLVSNKRRNNEDTIIVRTLPAQASASSSSSTVITFAQPSARKTLSLSQAEQAIQDQLTGVNRNSNRQMMRPNQDDVQQKLPLLFVPTTTNKATTIGINHPRSSKSRLLSKLVASESSSQSRAGGGDDDDDDFVMGDITYRNRKGGGGAARKELLALGGDGAITVNEAGVLGGTNDAVFAGGQRFANFSSATSSAGNSAKAAVATDKQERGADGAAMPDDFYQRDVGAEYEELDYDANEQFDDDDVDLGESEVVGDGNAHGRTGEDDDDDDGELDDMDLEEEVVTGAEGLATVAGFKRMLDKARSGELGTTDSAKVAPSEGGSEAASGATSAEKKKEGEDSSATLGEPSSHAPSFASEPEEATDHIAKIMAAAEKSAQAAKEKANSTLPAVDKNAKLVDENGLRIITLSAVRREIWLNHGSIPMKRLMKIFDIKKKSSPDRQNKFRECVKELCTMQHDPLGGKKLVLKQHYSNMG